VNRAPRGPVPLGGLRRTFRAPRRGSGVRAARRPSGARPRRGKAWSSAMVPSPETSVARRRTGCGTARVAVSRSGRWAGDCRGHRDDRGAQRIRREVLERSTVAGSALTPRSPRCAGRSGRGCRLPAARPSRRGPPARRPDSLAERLMRAITDFGRSPTARRRDVEEIFLGVHVCISARRAGCGDWPCRPRNPRSARSWSGCSRRPTGS
jgi:hypothetical protein